MPTLIHARFPAALALAAMLLAGCASKNPLIDEPAAAPAGSTVETKAPSRTERWFGFLTPYRVDIQQGNFVSKEMVAQLKEGMKRPEGVTRDQVRFALGTPLLTDMFHADRWDYIFRLRKGNGEVIESHITAFFKDNRLARIEGTVLPTEAEYLALIAGAVPPAK